MGSTLELVLDEVAQCNSHGFAPGGIADERGDGQDAQTHDDFLAAFDRLIALQRLTDDVRMQHDALLFGVSRFGFTLIVSEFCGGSARFDCAGKVGVVVRVAHC